jgi:CDP-diacylglycerol--glycerol-3-phosphate 3-phosphatidyltransferase
MTVDGSSSEEIGGDGRLAALKNAGRRIAHAALDPLVSLLVRLKVGANTLTTAGCLFGVGAGIAFFEGGFRIAALLLFFGGVCDILDGQIARRSAESRFGAFLDSTLDRFAEAFVLVGIAGFYMEHLLELVHDPTRTIEELSRGLEPRTWALLSLTALMGLVGSFMVSYTRARAEGLGLECRVGWFERPERLLLIMIAGALGLGPWMPAALLILMLGSFATAAQRVVHVWKNTRAR